MPISRITRYCGVALTALLCHGALLAVELDGEAIQGGLIFGKTSPGATVTLDETAVMVSPQGHFVIGFGRDESGERTLAISLPSGERGAFIRREPFDSRRDAGEEMEPVRTVKISLSSSSS